MGAHVATRALWERDAAQRFRTLSVHGFGGKPVLVRTCRCRMPRCRAGCVRLPRKEGQ